MFVVKRLAQALPTLFAVSLLVFFFVDLIPGDPAQILAGPTATDEEIRSIREFLGLNEPLINRYGRFLQGLWDPTVATSFRTHRPVVIELAERLPNTLIVATGGLVLGLLAGTVGGVICALRQGGIAEAAITVLTLAGISMPIYWLGLLCIWLFAVYLGWLPAAGASTAAHFVLPILVIATRPMAMFSRLVTTSLIEAMGKDYLDTARAKGLSESSVMISHALRNSLIAAVSVAGVQFGGMLGGSVVTETVFGIPGVGRLLVDAVSRADYPVIQYVILMFAVFFVAINLATDILTQWLDPRTRQEGRAA
jgi:peptide/nickel transport system permease protein/glutathione transport system permease protein